jgi:hypothetical protein
LWTYIKVAIRAHPFNFFTLFIALVAAVFGGWSAWEAHRTRLGADDASREQNKTAEKSLALAEKNATAVKELASVASAEQRQKMRSWLYAEGATWGPDDHQDIVVDLLNKGGSVAQFINSRCVVSNMEFQATHGDQVRTWLETSPGQHRNLFINATKEMEGHVECTVKYDDQFEKGRSLEFQLNYRQTDQTFSLFFVKNP